MGQLSMKILMMAGPDTKNQPQPFTEKGAKQPNGIICDAGVQFMPFIPQDRPKYHLIS
jgi:hypothetical protein